MLQSSLLSMLSEIRHAFFTRDGGVSDGFYASLNAGLGSRDAPERVAENRARMAAALGVARDRLVTAYQVHSPNVVVTTADCGPLLLADREAVVVGAAHAGWKGALAGVAEAAVDAMEQLGASRRRIVVALGPMIRQPNYEVGPDFVTHFTADDPENRRFFVPAARGGHAMFDLAGYIIARLQRAGVGRIEDLGHCTYADPARFFSYRRSTHRAEADYGRHISAIALRE
jgi:YfiH family protein